MNVSIVTSNFEERYKCKAKSKQEFNHDDLTLELNIQIH